MRLVAGSLRRLLFPSDLKAFLGSFHLRHTGALRINVVPFQGKADAKSVAAGAAAEAVKADAPAASAAPAAEATTASDLNGKRVLVLCQGGGTSGLLANALAKAAKERGINLETAAEAYGNHVDMLPDFDLVVLAPQAASYLADLQKDCGRVGNKCVACRGKQYIELSQNGDKSLAFVSEQLSK